MKPVFQKHTDVSQPELGDCLTACVASILELPLEAVPHFCHPQERNWPHNYRDWFGERGMAAIELKWPPDDGDVRIRMTLPVGTYFLVHGLSPRGGWQHAVVARYNDEPPTGYEIVHDPNPAGGGIRELRGLTFICLKEPWLVTCACGASPAPPVPPGEERTSSGPASLPAADSRAAGS